MPFPKSQAETNDLLQIWRVKVDDHSARYNLTVDQTNQIKDDAVLYNHLIAAGNQLETDREEFYSYKNNAFKGNVKADAADYPAISLPALPAPLGSYMQGIEKRNTELYNYFKKHPNRTEQSLSDLGITETTKTPIPPEELKPKLSGSAMPDDKVELPFNKQGEAKCRIQMRRGGGDWNTIGEPDFSPFVDETPSIGGIPERREYRAIYMRKNKPYGQYSDIIVIVTTP